MAWEVVPSNCRGLQAECRILPEKVCSTSMTCDVKVASSPWLRWTRSKMSQTGTKMKWQYLFLVNCGFICRYQKVLGKFEWVYSKSEMRKGRVFQPVVCKIFRSSNLVAISSSIYGTKGFNSTAKSYLSGCVRDINVEPRKNAQWMLRDVSGYDRPQLVQSIGTIVWLTNSFKSTPAWLHSSLF